MIRGALWPARAEAGPALLGGALFAVAFPPFPLPAAAFVALAPVAVAVARAADGDGTPGGAARVGLWFALLGYGCNLYWIAVALAPFTPLAPLAYAAAIACIAPLVALACAALLVVRRRARWPMALALPVVWVSLELALAHLGDLAFPWLPLGLAVAPHPLLAQIAELSGVRGVSFWIAATSGLLADAWLAWRRAARGSAARAAIPPLVAAAALAALVAGYGAWRMRSIAPRALAPVAVVQPGVPQERKWMVESAAPTVATLARLTRAATAAGAARLVIWPEVALPGYLESHPEWRDTLRALGAAARTPVLFGVLDVVRRAPGDSDRYNAAMLTDSLGALGARPAYHKRALVPFVERAPFAEPRWAGPLGPFGGYSRGRAPAAFPLPFGRAGVLICFESVFPQLAREDRRAGADFLVAMTNDAWFGRSIAPYQHAAHIALRAIETRAGVVRAANTGISEYADPLGRVHEPTEPMTADVRGYLLETTDVRTPYVRFGDWLGALSLAATVAIVAAPRWPPLRRAA